MSTCRAHALRRARIADIDGILAIRYGRPRWQSHAPPLEELIATILSQHTSDTNSARAFASLQAAFPSWRDVMVAPTAAVATAIRGGGLAELKAPRIQRVLVAVATETGELSLDWLRDRTLDEVRSWLLALPGVGPKTAACVLLFSLGLPAMPVDTHVHRVTWRLGLIDPNVTAERAHAKLEALIGPDREMTYSLHINLIRHGRDTCRSRSPACSRCVLQERCPSAPR